MTETLKKYKEIRLSKKGAKSTLPFFKKRNLVVKRIFDLTGSIFLSAVFILTLLPVLAILIKLGSSGPVFFVQNRTGRNGKIFRCYKLRSMVVNPDSDLCAVRENDSRITKIGSFMRRYFLDELPQLFNVVSGEMSLVGPRPHMVLHDIEYASLYERYKKRQVVKPGITGLAQVCGYHGSIHSEKDLKNRIDADISYIERWSVWLDIRILLHTTFFFIKPFIKRFGRTAKSAG